MKITISFFCFFLVVITKSQSVIFQQIYQCQVDQSAREAIEISNGGYMIIGMNEKSFGDTDVYIMKTNPIGDTIWTKSFGGTSSEYPNMIIETSNGNFLIVGYTLSYGSGSNDVWLLCIDINGNLIWSKTYGGTGDDEGKDIIATADGNYMITGRSNSPGNQGYDAFLIKIDLNGNIIWQNNYGGNQYETSRSVKQCSDGGYVFTGQTLSYGSGNGDVYMTKTDASGNLIWSKTFGGNLIDDGNVIIENSDGSFMIAAETNSYGSGDMDVWILKTDNNGNVIWQQTYGGTDKDVSKSMRMTSDGGYIIGAISRSFGWINPDMWLVKIDANGAVQWTSNFGSWDHEHCYSARQVTDGGFIAVGHTKSYGPVSKIMFIKLDQFGTTDNQQTLSEKISLNFFPNPVKNELNFYWPNKNEAEVETEIYTNDRKLISHQLMKRTENEIAGKINLTEYVPGFYILKFAFKNKTVYQTVIKQQ